MCLTYGGSCFIPDKNSSEFFSAEVREADDWNSLYKKTGYCPLRCDVYYDDIWLSPDGEFFYGDAHEMQAEDICSVIYGKTDISYFGDYLIANGWVKLTTGAMLHYYRQSSMYSSLSDAQFNAVTEWCKVHHIAPIMLGGE